MAGKKLTLKQFKLRVRLYAVAIFATFLSIPVIIPSMLGSEISTIVVPTAMAICTLLASSIPIVYLTIVSETEPGDRKKRMKRLLNVKKQSWSLLFAESLFAPLAVFGAGNYLYRLNYQPVNLIIMIAAMAVLASVFGVCMSRSCRKSAIVEYNRDFATEFLNSDTKVFHDLSAQFSLNAIIGFSALSSVVVCFYDLQASLQGLILMLACTAVWTFLLLTDRFRAFPHGAFADASIFVPPSLWLLPESMHPPTSRQ